MALIFNTSCSANTQTNKVNFFPRQEMKLEFHVKSSLSQPRSYWNSSLGGAGCTIPRICAVLPVATLTLVQQEPRVTNPDETHTALLHSAAVWAWQSPSLHTMIHAPRSTRGSLGNLSWSAGLEAENQLENDWRNWEGWMPVILKYFTPVVSFANLVIPVLSADQERGHFSARQCWA